MFRRYNFIIKKLNLIIHIIISLIFILKNVEFNEELFKKNALIYIFTYIEYKKLSVVSNFSLKYIFIYTIIMKFLICILNDVEFIGEQNF